MAASFESTTCRPQPQGFMDSNSESNVTRYALPREFKP